MSKRIECVFDRKINTPDDWHGTTNGKCNGSVRLFLVFNHPDIPIQRWKYECWTIFSGNDDFNLDFASEFQSLKSASKYRNRQIKWMRTLKSITQQELIDMGYKQL